MTRTRVAVVDDHRVLWPALKTALIGLDFEVVSTVASTDELPTIDLDLVVCDLHLPWGPSGAEAVRSLVDAGRPVLAISGVAHRESVLDAVEAGARGFVDKGADIADVAGAAWAVHADGVHISAQLAGFLLDDARRRPLGIPAEVSSLQLGMLRGLAQGDTVDEVARTHRLRRTDAIALLTAAWEVGRRRRRILRPTPAELEVMERVACRGMSNEAIAAELTISKWTVTSRLDNIRVKYRTLHPDHDLPPRSAAMLWARQLDLCWEREVPN